MRDFLATLTWLVVGTACVFMLTFLDFLVPWVAHRECIDGKGMLTAMCVTHGISALLIVFFSGLMAYKCGLDEAKEQVHV